jgi:hypothetical protein
MPIYIFKDFECLNISILEKYGGWYARIAKLVKLNFMAVGVVFTGSVFYSSRSFIIHIIQRLLERPAGNVHVVLRGEEALDRRVVDFVTGCYSTTASFLICFPRFPHDQISPRW